MAAIIKIDQVGLPAGVADQSRSDGLATGAVVTLTSVSPGTSNTWALLWTPDADTTAYASLTPSGVTATFTPTVGARGTYRIQLTVDGVVSIRTFSVRTADGLRIPALNEGASADASLINAGAGMIAVSETNEPIAGTHFSGGSYGGWYSALVELYTKIGDIIAGAPALHASTHVPGATDALLTAIAGAIAIGDTAAIGAAASFSRSDHRHSLAAPAAPVDVTKAAAAAGSSTAPARADHKHDITTAAPTTGIGAANSEGAASTLARSDHSHALRTTTGPTDLAMGAIADGEFLKRVGATIVSATVSGGTQTVQDEGATQSSTVTTFNFTGAGVTASGGGATATINIPGGSGGGGIVDRRTVTGPTTAAVATTDHLILVDTSGGAVTLTLPDPATTDRIYEIKDIAGTFGTNACTLARTTGTDQIEGLAANYLLEANWQIQRIGSNGATKWYLL